jgi:uncharacterized protein (DUF1778 family)
MTSLATKLLEDFQSLPPEEQLLVRERVLRLTESRQREALERLHGASAGKNALKTLLADRSRENRRG